MARGLVTAAAVPENSKEKWLATNRRANATVAFFHNCPAAPARTTGLARIKGLCHDVRVSIQFVLRNNACFSSRLRPEPLRLRPLSLRNRDCMGRPFVLLQFGPR